MLAIALQRWRVCAGLAASLLLCVATMPVEAVVDFTLTTQHAIKVGSAGLDYYMVDCILTNTGTTSDSYDVLRRTQTIPPGWITAIGLGGIDGFLTNGNVTHPAPPFVDSVYAGNPPCGFPSCGGPSFFSLNPGQQDTVSCLFFPGGPEGSGYVAFTVRSNVDPAFSRTIVMGMVTDGVDVLVMDDDGGQTLESYYEAAVPGTFARGTWHRDVSSVTSAELSNFPFVIWFTGASPAGLGASDRAAIAGYLGDGGRLILSGQDVAYDLCDPASPNFSLSSLAWYETQLKTRYVANNSSSTSLTGIAGDPISDGLHVMIEGGSGANNQTDPDRLSPLAGAGSVWTYSPGNQVAATRVLGQGYRALNLGFGFEAVAEAADRQTILVRALDWLAAGSVGIADAEFVPTPPAIAIEEVRPNPFNPATVLGIRLARSGNVELRILDPNGRVVQTLIAGMLSAGRHQVFWDGRDDQGRGVATGVYFAEVSMAQAARDRAKLILIR